MSTMTAINWALKAEVDRPYLANSLATPVLRAAAEWGLRGRCGCSNRSRSHYLDLWVENDDGDIRDAVKIRFSDHDLPPWYRDDADAEIHIDDRAAAAHDLVRWLAERFERPCPVWAAEEKVAARREAAQLAAETRRTAAEKVEAEVVERVAAAHPAGRLPTIEDVRAAYSLPTTAAARRVLAEVRCRRREAREKAEAEREARRHAKWAATPEGRRAVAERERVEAALVDLGLARGSDCFHTRGVVVRVRGGTRHEPEVRVDVHRSRKGTPEQVAEWSTRVAQRAAGLSR